MSDKKYFNILSIDGGGIKGLYAARILEHIEAKYGKRILDHIDMICGTSTGGLIALALSLGHSARDIADFYAANGSKIFPHRNWFQSFFYGLRQATFGNKYQSPELRAELEAFFGKELRIKNCKSLLCIPAFNISRGRPIVFKYPHKEGGFSRDGEINVVDAALATSAAPTYFKNHQVNAPTLPNTLCTDGGVWCNNPSLAGLLEAWDYYVGESKAFDAIRLISISTINKPSGEEFKGGGFLTWNKRLIGTAMNGQAFFSNFFMERLMKNPDFPVEYLRIQTDNLSAKEHTLIRMDRATPSSIQALNRLGIERGTDLVTQPPELLSAIFSQKKLYQIN